VLEGEKAKRVKIETGFDGGDWLEVVKGLTGSDEVVVLGTDLVTDGAPVSAKRKEEPPKRKEEDPAKRPVATD
jgi:hypothetical protein